MTSELQERLSSVVGFLEKSANSAQNFVIDQAPDVVQQILRWNFAYSLIVSVIGIILCVTVLIISFRIHKLILSHRGQFDTFEDYAPAYLILFFISGILMVIAVAMAFDLNWLKILIAPKLYLIEYVSTFIK